MRPKVKKLVIDCHSATMKLVLLCTGTDTAFSICFVSFTGSLIWDAVVVVVGFSIGLIFCFVCLVVSDVVVAFLTTGAIIFAAVSELITSFGVAILDGLLMTGATVVSIDLGTIGFEATGTLHDG